MNGKGILEIAKRVDERFKEYFKNDERIKSIFVVGSMADLDKYEEKKDNDYDIRAVASEVNKELIDGFNNFLQTLSEEETNEEVEVGYSTAVGPVNHELSEDKKNFLIHGMIHEKSQLDDFLPKTHKHTYSKNHRIIQGENYLQKYDIVRFNLDDLLNGHEGLNYCIDMLENREHRYLDWDTSEGGCEFKFHKDEMPQEMANENCFYSTNKFLSNLQQYGKWNDLEVPENKMESAMKLLGDKFDVKEVRSIIECIVNKDAERFKKLANDPVKLTTYILREFNYRINEKGLENIYREKELVER